MRTYLAVLTLLVALASGLWAFEIVDVWGEATQPDGTTFGYHAYHDKRFTADGYVIVYGSDGWYYYAELDARGEYEASPYKVGIDNPAEIGIPRNLQRSAVRQAEKDAAMIRQFDGRILTQPDGTMFHAYSGGPLPTKPCPIRAISDERCWPRTMDAPADGYVIAIFLDYDDSGVCVNCDTIPIDYDYRLAESTGWYFVINYNGGDPFWSFVYDDESGWYYYAELNAQGEYVASPYRVGIDNPPGYDPPTAVQERSWGAVKHLFLK